LENNLTSFSFYDGKHLPFDNCYFDAVVAHAVIEHVPSNVISFLFQEIQRVLKPQGYFFIFRTPRKQATLEHLARLLRLGSHEILIDEQEICLMLKIYNFDIISIRRTDLILSVLHGNLQDFWNRLTPALLKVDELLLDTPLNYFAHHLQVVSQKLG
jgi:SAM-dependent methyltransferase